MNEQEEQTADEWERLRISVRGYIVPSASQVRRRGEHRGKSRKPSKPAKTTDNNAASGGGGGEEEHSRPVLTEEEERQAVAMLGPRPWWTLTYDSETVVVSLSNDGQHVAVGPLRLSVAAVPSLDVLRVGQPLRVAYYELRGLSIRAVAWRLRTGRLKSEDRHRLVEAGFVLPDPDEVLADYGRVGGARLAPIYRGWEPILAADRLVVEEYVARHQYRGEHRGIAIRGKQDFIKHVIYRHVYQGRARFVGHNAHFDITRLITDSVTANGRHVRGVWQGAKQFRRGFTMKLCDCLYESCWFHPPISVVKLGRFKHRYQFTKRTLPGKGGQVRKHDYTGKFLDTLTFGLTLRKTGASLEVMADAFKTSVRKGTHPDFAGPLDGSFLSYLVADVQTTYWLSVAELADYKALGLSRRAESVYSTASLAKALKHDAGYPPSKDRVWHLDIGERGESGTSARAAQDVNGYAATSYYGGRAEVGYRGCFVGRPAEVLHLDFKSQYVAVGHLMDLQRYENAESVSACDATDRVRTKLAALSPADVRQLLQDPATWRDYLAVLVRLRPNGKLLLPVRAHFPKHGRPHNSPSLSLNIGQAYVKSETPLWYTLADVLAGYIRAESRDALPDILAAIAFTPSAEQLKSLKPVTVAGQTIDPRTDIVWTELINRRRAIKHAAEDAHNAGNMEAAGRLGGQQKAVKEMALAGSYGVMEEINERLYEGKAIGLDVYALGKTHRLGNVIEEPGQYFAGVVGTFIPAGGRLLLALAESLLGERGIGYVFMDTDSITPLRPDGMTREDFRRHVQAVVDAFVLLNVYAEPGSLLAYEDQNYAVSQADPNKIDKSRMEPLYAIPTSAKRYVEFNIVEAPDGQTGERVPILRKFTRHGLGPYGTLDGEVTAAPAWASPPHTYRTRNGECVPDSTDLGGPLWVYALEWEYVYTMLNGHYPNGDPLSSNADGTLNYLPRHGDECAGTEWLERPAYSQFSIGTWADYVRMRHLPGLRPGGFITVYPGRVRTEFVDDTINLRSERVTTLPSPGPPPSHHQLGTRAPQTAPVREGALSTVLNSMSTACYSPFVRSGVEAQALLAKGEIRRVANDTPLPPDYELKTMWEVVAGYFQHPELKATKPYGVGQLEHKHIIVSGVDVNGIESNRIAQAAARDTAGILGDVEQTGGRQYGDTVPTEREQSGVRIARLANLVDADLPDLLAASCLSRRTLETLGRTAYTMTSALPETRAALDIALQLLRSDHPKSIAGWRDVLTVEALADLLDTSEDDARDRLRGRVTWTTAERARLVTFMTERREALAPPPPSEEDGENLVCGGLSTAEVENRRYLESLWKRAEHVEAVV